MSEATFDTLYILKEVTSIVLIIMGWFVACKYLMSK